MTIEYNSKDLPYLKLIEQKDMKYKNSLMKKQLVDELIKLIDAFHIEIASEGLIVFKGGKFNTTTEVVDAIQVNPDIKDTFSLWKIIIIKGNWVLSF